MSELKKSLIEAVESKGAGIVIPMLNPKDLQVKISAVVPPAYADAIECDKRWSERFAKQCEEVVEQHKDVLDFEDESRFNGNEPVVAEKPVKIEDQKLTESTHAAVAKPEGDKVKSFNNALKYAKRDEVPYCYGYFNSRLGKFFAFDQPFKWDGDDKAFRAQYKNTSTIYVAYPNNAFVKESMQESYSDNLKNSDYWQHQVDYQLEHFGRVGGGLIQDLDEAGFYLNASNKVMPKVEEKSLAEGLERSFVELPTFKANWKRLGLDEEDLRDLQNDILNSPEQGIPLGSNAFKIRFKPKDTNHGKNTSHRAIYVDVIKESKIYLTNVFSKADEANLTSEELKAIRAFAKEMNS